MHFDLDLKSIHTDDLVCGLLETLQESVNRFLSAGLEKESWAIACAVLDNEQASRKSAGLHVVFPWLFVNTEQALWIRAGVVSELHRLHEGLQEDWDTVVDIAVLTTNGLRMVGSDKCKDCPTCHNMREARDFCPDCSRQGKIPENKIYWPWRTYPLQETRQLCRDVRGNPAYAVQMCSTRIPVDRQIPTKQFLVPEGAPPPSLRRKLSAAEAKRTAKDHALTEIQPSTRWRTEPVELSAELRTALEETLHAHCPKYATLRVSALERLLGTRHRESFCMKVRGFGCRFCQNKNEEHTKQTVYFIVSRQGLAQKCYSRKNVLRQHGLCEKYCSPSTPLSPSLQALLYGGGAEEKSFESCNCSLDIAAKMWGAGRSVRPRLE